MCGLGRLLWQRRTRALLDRLHAAELPAAPSRVTADALAGLPPPLARHLQQALPADAPIIRRVRVVHEGQFNLSPDGERWRPFRSRQWVVTRRPGFVWDGCVSMAPGLPVHVHDAYVAGEGLLRPALFGLLPLANLHDRDEVARGELMRFLAEACWYPTALLPQESLSWSSIDARHARAQLRDGDLTVTLDFQFDNDGLIESMRSETRGRSVGGQMLPTPWEGRMSNYQRVDGMLVPLDGEVAWLVDGERRPYWRGRIVEIEHQY